MGKQREPLFGASDDTSEKDDLGDLSRFEVKKRAPGSDAAPQRRQIREIADSAGFQSRDPRAQDATAGRGGRVTGRNVQINLKARPGTIEAFSAIADRHDWSKALTFERAVVALERLLDEGVDPKSLDRED